MTSCIGENKRIQPTVLESTGKMTEISRIDNPWSHGQITMLSLMGSWGAWKSVLNAGGEHGGRGCGNDKKTKLYLSFVNKINYLVYGIHDGTLWSGTIWQSLQNLHGSMGVRRGEV